MTDIGISIFIIWALSIIFTYIVSKDMASPQIVFMTILGFFFSDIFFSNYHYYIYAIYIVMILVVLVSTIPYFFIHRKCDSYASYGSTLKLKENIKRSQKLPTPLFWIVSFPGILAMYYLINKFGGLDGYLIAAQFRTREFHGLGAIKTIISTYYVVNIYYFSCIINENYIRNKKEYFLFGAHVAIALLLATVSFSRGTLLMGMVFMGLIWHYSRSRIKPFRVISGLSVLLILASLLGVVRETFNIDNGMVNLGLEGQEQKFKPTWMIYGTFPLESVVNSDHIDKKLGQTYLTAVTNFIPRYYWPEKPEPGGVVFTKEYTKNMYDEYSHFTTGIIPEAMINFGIGFGVLFGIFHLFSIIFLLTYFYIKFYFHKKKTVQTDKHILIMILYIYSVVGGALLVTGEFTSVTIGWIIKVIVTLSIYSLIQIFYKSKIKF